MFNKIIFCGASGSGKSTLINRLLAQYPNKFKFSVSHTTRPPREGEVNGKDYWFISKEEFQNKLNQSGSFFMEHAHVHSNYYGTSFNSVDKVIEDGYSCILDIDVQGVESAKKVYVKDVCYIFICPPSLSVLEDRLRSRGTESEEAIATRLNNAKNEMTYADRGNGFWDLVIINDDLEGAYSKLIGFLKL